jgi:malonyl-CoA O-methyltransferase
MTVRNRYFMDQHLVARHFNSAVQRYDDLAVLQKTVAQRLLERLDVMRISPRNILDLGAGTGATSRRLAKRYRKAQVIQLDLALRMLSHSVRTGRWFRPRRMSVCADAMNLPIATGVMEMVFSNLMLQWCNDPGVVFAEVRRVMRPEGLFIFSSFGPDTLQELRDSWSTVDDDTHVHAFIDMHDIGDVLIKTGFTQPVLEAERFTLTYPDTLSLFRELKQLGAANAATGRRHTLTGKRRLKRALEAYEKFRVDGRIPVTYEVIYGHAWRGAAAHAAAPNRGVYSVPVSAITRRRS